MRTVAAGAVAAAVLSSSGTAYALWSATGAGGASVAARQLPVPGSVSATCVPPPTHDAVTITWTSQSTPVVTGFAVDRSTDGGTSWTTVASPVAAAGTTSYSVSDSGLTEATYVYRVSTRNGSWTSLGAVSATRTVLEAITNGRPQNRRPASCT